ncbi:Uncharacterized protein TCM_038092 [Theobroma cacao]|uniref:Uncharacterized protein n=1 Tax=Theobroma cacao TaxID=3641 RepID=A0A061GVD5_THECC|nr:Uncharacterized protein TCM_038092 [Theobroma cacao]
MQECLMCMNISSIILCKKIMQKDFPHGGLDFFKDNLCPPNIFPKSSSVTCGLSLMYPARVTFNIYEIYTIGWLISSYTPSFTKSWPPKNF